MYNLSNLEPKFKKYLLAENISSVTLRNYLSDLRHFLGWTLTRQGESQSTGINDLSRLNRSAIENYRDSHLSALLPVKTINRRLSAIRKFLEFCKQEGLIPDNPGQRISNINLSKPKKELEREKKQIGNELNIIKLQSNLIDKQKNIKNSWIKLNYLPFLFIPLIFLFFLVINKTSSVQNQPIVLSSKLPSSKHLTFKGRLIDDLGNPISTKTDVIFKLYSQSEGGNPLYQSDCKGQNGAITPNVDGTIEVNLGSDCDQKPIPSTLFLDNQNIYLGISVGSDSEMLPRQNIPNVGFASNASTIQGLSIGTNELSVPYINEDGSLLIGTKNGGIKSTFESENFSISSAESVTIESSAAGDVVLQATESGMIKLRTGGFSDTYTRLTINNEGNIGIGTLFPTYGLEVNDDLKITNGNRLILASASSDPSGENGAIYYNIQSNKFRCYQDGVWIDCISGQSANSPIGGIYDGNLQNDGNTPKLEKQIDELKNRIDQLITQLNNLTNSSSEKFSELINTEYRKLTTNLSVREKITSPVIETEKLKTKEITTKDENLVIDLSSSSEEPTTENRLPTTDHGPLASLIIKGLEGKNVAIIDSAGNASFSGQLAADNLQINNNATIAGTLRADNIESENLNQLTQNVSSLSGTLSDLNQKNNGTIEQLNNDVNSIQKLLADIKNQPLPNPEFYQKLDNQNQWNSETMEQLTVTNKSNIFDLAVTNSANIGNLLVSDNSILSLAWDLKLSALTNVKFFDDAVVISKDGNIRTIGKVIANSGVVTNKIEALNENENVTINDLAISNLTINEKYLASSDSASLIASADNFKKNGLSSPAIETQTAIAGSGLIPAGSQEIIIYNSKITDNSLVYLTPTIGIVDSNLSVSKKEPCNNITIEQSNNQSVCKQYFKVSIDKPAINALTFNWLILN